MPPRDADEERFAQVYGAAASFAAEGRNSLPDAIDKALRLEKFVRERLAKEAADKR